MVEIIGSTTVVAIGVLELAEGVQSSDVLKGELYKPLI
jgi:hypothetical protein